MASSPLLSLPKELLRQICSNIPCASALDVLLVCRLLYQSCNDWTVWKDCVVRSLDAEVAGTIPDPGDRDEWKRYAIAISRATRCSGTWSTQDLEQWLPQLTALTHPSVLEPGPWSLVTLSDIVFDSVGLNLTNEEGALRMTRITDGNIQSALLHSWTLAQCTAFTLTLQYLSGADLHSSADELLHSMPWTDSSSVDSNQDSEGYQAELCAKQHALANRAVGFIYAKLQLAYYTQSAELASLPPTAKSIPLLDLLKLPAPFTPNSIYAFSKCHLATMTEPSFFVQGEWTGYTSITGGYGCGFNGVGGPHHDGFGRPGAGGSSPAGFFPRGRLFEGVVRFQLIGENNSEEYELESNNFYSQAELPYIQVTVKKNSGQIKIRHWHRFIADFGTSTGVITPFGIVSYLNSRGLWLWLWKTGWSRERF